MKTWIDVYCTEPYGRRGGICGRLLMKVQHGTVGVVETACPRCRTIQEIPLRIPQPLAVST